MPNYICEIFEHSCRPGSIQSIPVILLLTGCERPDLIDLKPGGPVAHSIDELFWLTLALMALVLAVVFVLTIWVVTRYRASGQPADYDPHWQGPAWLEWLIWMFPASIVAVLAWATWINTHKLDPYRPLHSRVDPIEIQAVALDWKWLFIYPEQRVASVNQVAFPVHRPVVFKITSATVMNSFFIPRLAGQIYAMAGMETQLHLLADRTGRYFGENSQYSGKGFPYQNFEALVLNKQDFSDWLDRVKRSPSILDSEQFQQLAKPSIKDDVKYYGDANHGLFKRIIDQFDAGKKHAAALTGEN